MQYATTIGQHQVPTNVGIENISAKSEHIEKPRFSPSSDISSWLPVSAGSTLPQSMQSSSGEVGREVCGKSRMVVGMW
jgi:hypothetical protein